MRKMTRSLRLTVLASVAAVATLVGGAAASFAQEPAPATAGSGESAQAVVGFFEGLAAVADEKRNDCPSMGKALNDYLDQNQQVLRDAAYSPEQASAEQETAINAAATRLGTTAGTCYEEASVATFFERFATLAASLDG